VKLCRECFRARYGDAQVRVCTWGRVCDGCQSPTPSMSTLIKVTPELDAVLN
jgi:hypothetical protein